MTGTRLLHLSGPSKFGGDSVLILEMARASRDRGFIVDVLTTDPRFQQMVIDEGFGLIDLQAIVREIRPITDLRGLGRLTSFLRSAAYDIVHTHTSKPGVLGRLAATRAGVPAIVHTVHGFGFHEETGRAATAAYVSIERRAARWCHRIVTVSEFHRQRALSLGIGSPEQVVAIPNGVPEERAQSRRPVGEVRAEFGVDEGLMVVSTGRLAEQKGLEYLIRAVPHIPPGGPAMTIVVAGDGPLHEHLSGLVKEVGVGDRVLLPGFRSDVGDLLASSDIFVMPSLWEGLSISLLEAMAAGKPVVTTSIGSNCEVTNDGEVAILVPPKNPIALARALHSLAVDPLRRQSLGEAGRAVQQQRYTMSKMLASYAELYDALLQPSPPAPRSESDA